MSDGGEDRGGVADEGRLPLARRALARAEREQASRRVRASFLRVCVGEIEPSGADCEITADFFRRGRSKIRAQILTPIMPISVERTVATSEGKRKSAGLAEPAVARMPMTVVGRICRLVAEMTVSIIMSAEARGLPSSMRLRAVIAMGVAALPSPKRLADTFMVMYLRVSTSQEGNSREITGRSRRSSPRDKPSRSISAKNPNQNA